ncbi:hypothetical protein H6758_05185, partial [Candidatus Nomurabacteria bacterium]|nr:hypothetical protein [Candidatus Nomurabacteria bacterium]
MSNAARLTKVKNRFGSAIRGALISAAATMGASDLSESQVNAFVDQVESKIFDNIEDTLAQKVQERATNIDEFAQQAAQQAQDIAAA